MRRIAAMLLVLLVLASTTWNRSAAAVEPCAPRWLVIDILSRRHGETVFVSGITSIGSLLEFFLNVETGTWTIVLSAPGGPSCIWVTGVAWADIKPIKKKGI